MLAEHRHPSVRNAAAKLEARQPHEKDDAAMREVGSLFEAVTGQLLDRFPTDDPDLTAMLRELTDARNAAVRLAAQQHAGHE